MRRGGDTAGAGAVREAWRVLAGLSGALLVFPVYSLARWIVVVTAEQRFEAARTAHVQTFPFGLRSPWSITLVGVGCCVSAAAAAAAGARITRGGRRQALQVVIAVALALGGWNLWSLM